tara:strand:+ start:338 stop:481 length:144 start_codon:yes stop_codon:yes gene_type:complete
MKNLTKLQSQYISDCKMLQAIGVDDSLFDGLYLEQVKHLKTKKKRKK